MRKSLYVRKADEAEFEAVYKDVEELARTEALASGDTDAGVAGIILDLLKRWLEEKKAREEEFRPYVLKPFRRHWSEYSDSDEPIQDSSRPVEFVGREIVPAKVGEHWGQPVWNVDPAYVSVEFDAQYYLYETMTGLIVVEYNCDSERVFTEGSWGANLVEVCLVAWFNSVDDIPTEKNVVGTLERDEESQEWLVCPNRHAVTPPERPELRTLKDVREHGALVTPMGQVLREYKPADKAADIVVVPREIVDAARVQLDKVEPIRLD